MPKRKPTKLKIVEGNRGKRKLDLSAEPQPDPVSDLTAPETLSGIAKAEWQRTAKHLHKIGLLSCIDRQALEAYCRIYEMWQQAQSNLAQEGLTVVNEKGESRPNPLARVILMCLSEMRRYMGEFGMTPSSRAKITVEKAQATDDFDQFVKRTVRK